MRARDHDLRRPPQPRRVPPVRSRLVFWPEDDDGSVRLRRVTDIGGRRPPGGVFRPRTQVSVMTEED